MEKFLFYNNHPTDMVCIPAHRLVEMIIDNDSNAVTLHHRVYADGTHGSDMQYLAHMSVTAGKAKQVIETISNNISTGKDAFIVVADDVNGEYIDNNITNLSGLVNIG